MSLNVILYFVWCLFFAVVAGNFLHGLPLFILLGINTIAAYTVLIPKVKHDDD